MSSEWVYSLADISAGFSIQQTLSQQAQLQSLSLFNFTSSIGTASMNG